MASPVVLCRNCGSPHVRRHCADCGQEVVDEARSTWRIVRDAFADATDLDGRVARTARALGTPGALTVAFRDGRRVPYLGPVKLFLTASTVLTATWIATRGVDARYYGFPAGDAAAAGRYIDAVVRGTMLAVAGVSLGAWIGAPRRRFVEHVVFALHLITALSVWTAGIIWLGTAWKAAWGRVDVVPTAVPALPLLLFLPAGLVAVGYIAGATRGVYGTAWWATATRTTLFVVVMVWAVTFTASRVFGT